MTQNTTAGPHDSSPALAAIMNLSKCHRDHEKFYAAPLEQAVALRRDARALIALADGWSGLAPTSPATWSEFELAPAEIARLRRDLRSTSDDAAATAEWLQAVMESSWVEAELLLDVPELADVLGERHRIIANDWQAALLSGLVAKLLRRADTLLDRVVLDSVDGRRDPATVERSAKVLYSAAEMVGHAADLLSDSAALDGDNARRWRVFRARVRELPTTYDAATR